MTAVGLADQLLRGGAADVVVAGGSESMTRAPFVIAKAEKPWDRTVAVHDTSLGWRFVNPALDALYGTETMPRTAENAARRI
jgi:acetyl-CoA acetyltransferase